MTPGYPSLFLPREVLLDLYHGDNIMNSPTHTVYSQHTPIPTPKKNRKISTHLEVPGVHGDNPGVPGVNPGGLGVNPGGQAVNLGGLDVNPAVLEVLHSAQDNIHGMKAQRCHLRLKFQHHKKKTTELQNWEKIGVMDHGCLACLY